MLIDAPFVILPLTPILPVTVTVPVNWMAEFVIVVFPAICEKRVVFALLKNTLPVVALRLISLEFISKLFALSITIPPVVPSFSIRIPPAPVLAFTINIPLLVELVVLISTSPDDDPIVFFPEFVVNMAVPVPSERTAVFPPNKVVIELPPPPVALISFANTLDVADSSWLYPPVADILFAIVAEAVERFDSTEF